MLQIDWIFAESGGEKKVGFAEFVVALSRAPHESLFSTDLIKTLVDHFWKRYYRAVIFYGFLPFMAYMITTLIYVSYYTVEGVETNFFAWTDECRIRMIMLLVIFYFMFYEYKCMVRDGWHYVFDVFNYVDALSFSFNLYLISVTITGEHKDEDK